MIGTLTELGLQGLRALGEGALFATGIEIGKSILKKGETAFKVIVDKLQDVLPKAWESLKKAGKYMVSAGATILTKIKSIARKLADFIERHPKASAVAGATAVGVAVASNPQARKVVASVVTGTANLLKLALLLGIVYFAYKLFKR